MPEGTTSTTIADLDDNQILIYGSNVTGIESQLNFDFKTGASTKATVVLGEDCIFPNDVSIGNDLTVTGDLSVATLSGTIGGTPTISTAWIFSGAPNISGGGILNGSFSGNPQFTGNWTNSGLPIFSHASGLKTDVISENEGGVGVTVDGLLIKDGTLDATEWPRFGAKLSASQTPSGLTKVQFNTEEFDEGSDYDNATNYRWTPSTSGTYIITAGVFFISTNDGEFQRVLLYKNGASFKTFGYNTSGANTISSAISGAAVVQANGTDYFEIFAEAQTNRLFSNVSYFSGSRIA